VNGCLTRLYPTNQDDAATYHGIPCAKTQNDPAVTRREHSTANVTPTKHAIAALRLPPKPARKSPPKPAPEVQDKMTCLS
jgi:hypothetical protein